jgi:uncharacterized protein YggE
MKKMLTVLVLLVSTPFVAASDTRPTPSVTVTGNGKIVYIPDIGYIRVGISSNGLTTAEAWKKNEEIVKKIFAELKKLGVEEKDLKTGNLSVQPRYSQKPKEEPKFLGYTVTYELNVTVRKLGQMGALLDAMVDAGANREMNISFGCSKMDELIEQARAKAVADARKRANLYVTGAGARLGDVLSISDTPCYPQFRNYPVDAMALHEAKINLPVAAGEQEVTIPVTITWTINNSRLEDLTPSPAAL